MKKSIKNWRHWYLGFIIFLIIVGIIDTSYQAYNLYHCVGCSAPYSLAFIVPGAIYLFVITILTFIYFLISKKYRYALALGILLVLLIITVILKIFGIL